MAAYTTIDDPSAYFQTKIYTGTGSSNAFTLDGNSNLQPDWVWIKHRGEAHNHYLYDSVRGVQLKLSSNTTAAEIDMGSGSDAGLTAFGSNGFTIGGDTDENASSESYVAWNWKAGGSASSNSNGSITSSVSASTDAGFSIVSYTGTGSNATVGHGLGAVPKMIITKDRNNSNAWYVYHVGIGNTHGLRLSTTDAKEDDATLWNDTTPTSSVFSVSSNTGTNRSSNPIIAYCFTNISGYSKFGGYTGNGNANGTFVHTGFKPAFVLLKNADEVEQWWIFDNKRNAYDGNFRYYSLNPNATSAEGTTSGDNNHIDFLSNGFKLRTTAQQLNGASDNFIYMAFAESPFTNSNGTPNNAE